MVRTIAVVLLVMGMIGQLIGSPLKGVQAAVSDWQQGASIQPTSSTDFSSNSFKESVNSLKATGANYVTLIIPYTQSTTSSTDIRRRGDTPTDESLVSAIQYIHGQGMQVMVKIHLELDSGQWRAYIDAGDRAAWFKAYGDMLVHYAKINKAQKVEEFCLGAELYRMASPNHNSANTQSWKNMVTRVKAEYGGLLTYSANHGTPGEVGEIAFWDVLDFIGIAAYYPLAQNQDFASVDSLKSAWNNKNINHIKPIADRWQKPVLFTEVGYKSVEGSHKEPFAWGRGGSYDPDEQVRLYEALLQYWNGQNFMRGVHWWDWSSNPNAGGQGNTDCTPQNKPAESVLKSWFGGGSSASPTPTASATPTMTASPTPTATPSSSVSFIVTGSVTPSSPVKGSTATVSVAVKPSRATTNLVDVEIYDAAGQRVHQMFFDSQNLNTSGSKFEMVWTAENVGAYQVKVGIFGNGWNGLVYWEDNVLRFNVGASATVSPTASPTPSPTATARPTPTSTATPTPQPTASGTVVPTATPKPSSSATPLPSAGRSIEIWWPTAGTTLQGIQPFKGLVQGLGLGDYSLWWQVDGGVLNEMFDNMTDYPHKEVLVDVSGWNWRGDGWYLINFVAKDKSGNLMGQKSLNVNIAR